MDPIVFVIVSFFVGGVIAIGVWVEKRRTDRFEALLESGDDPAFDQGTSYSELSRERLDEIRHLVDRVGVVRINEQQSSSSKAPPLQWEVYLLDTNGVFHGVAKVVSEVEAAEMALELADQLDIPIDDPDHITAGRQ